MTDATYPQPPSPEGSTPSPRPKWMFYLAVGVALVISGFALSGRPAGAPSSTPPPAESPRDVAASPASSGFEYCGVTGPKITPETSVSEYTISASDRDSYCQGFRFVYYNFTDYPGVCREFWATPDMEMIYTFMAPHGGGHDYSSSVGMTDALWVVC